MHTVLLICRVIVFDFEQEPPASSLDQLQAVHSFDLVLLDVESGECAISLQHVDHVGGAILLQLVVVDEEAESPALARRLMAQRAKLRGVSTDDPEIAVAGTNDGPDIWS